MNRIFLSLTAFVFLASCHQQSTKGTSAATSITIDSNQKDSLLKATTTGKDTTKSVLAEYLIVPGKSIGQTSLGGNADSLIQKLGKPDKGDAAMGAQMMTWYARHDTSGYLTTVYSHRNMGGKDEIISRIKQIRITSPAFKTADHIGVGSTLSNLQKCYQLKAGTVPGGKDASLKLYDDVTAGIAFEVDASGACKAVIIHAPRDSAATYLDMR